jgi:cytochrome c-type biogenesis protein CcmH
MFLWIVMAVLTVAASLSILVPLGRPRRGQAAAAAEISIYRDQLDEIDRDVGRGLIAEGEADAARTEIARRLIRAGEAAAGRRGAASARGRRIVALAALVGVPVLALGLYFGFGSPELADAPLSARLSAPPAEQDIAALVARVEKHLADKPDDGRGWDLIGPVYVKLGRYDDAAKAYGNAIRLLGSTEPRESDLGEAIVGANGGAITPEARAAFERAANLDKTAVRPRFYIALDLAQAGKTEEAIAAWHSLLQDAPVAGAPWVAIARENLAKLEAAGAAPGPGAKDVEAASKMTAGDRLAMIEGMVASLDEKLEANPEDAEGWARLIRSYMVLGRPADAKAALAKARTALAGKPDRLAIVEAEAKAQGFDAAGAPTDGTDR